MVDFPSPHDAPALIALHGRCSVLTPDGEILTLSVAETRAMLSSLPPPLVIHGPATARRLEITLPPGPAPWLDLLELFAFVSPAMQAVPTPRGLATGLGLSAERIGDAEADLLPEIATILLARAQSLRHTPAGEEMAALLVPLGQAGWPWTGALRAMLDVTERLDERAMQPGDALRVWRRLPKWEETAARPPPASNPVSPASARARLDALRGAQAESRAGQADFASVATEAFAPRLRPGDPKVVLAEAGTGTGKTLGYLAPASVWSEENAGSVWVSTYTRHLQRQIESETRRLHPDAAIRRRHVVVRKGRENYLCLLNMEEALNVATSRGRAGHGATIALCLLARWATATADGDLIGGDLPGWFSDLVGAGNVAAMADRRGECIHGACAHYQRCFVEHTIRRAREADIVIANHALVMSQASWVMPGHAAISDEDNTPTRYVFDEGHHIADAADGAFSVELSGMEAAELRRWLLGAEGSRSRARGLRRRLDDLVVGFDTLERPMDEALRAARALPAPGWSGRIAAMLDPQLAPAAPSGPTDQNPAETFLLEMRRQLLARSTAQGEEKSAHLRGVQECDLYPASDALRDAAKDLAAALSLIATPLRLLAERLHARLQDEADVLDSNSRGRIEAMMRTLHRRAISRLDGWVSMLEAVVLGREDVIVPTYVHFIRSSRREGQHPSERDVGLHRHWLDPTIPFATTIAASAQGMLITSATLRDQTANSAEAIEHSWETAEERVGTCHLPSPAIRASLTSPFDYAEQTRAFIINDVAHEDIRALAGAYRSLFMASKGGALGLFTAIARLRAVHREIAPHMDDAGIGLYAQHVDAIDNATLVDIFRTEIDSCLLGTDAMRDGIDVPGQALRLVAFERVPWPRPDILHRERRIHLSHGNSVDYDDAIARLKLRQAFGRLVRVREDRGVFVLLDRRTPSRLLSAFPEGVVVRRTGLADAVLEIGRFLDESA